MPCGHAHLSNADRSRHRAPPDHRSHDRHATRCQYNRPSGRLPRGGLMEIARCAGYRRLRVRWDSSSIRASAAEAPRGFDTRITRRRDEPREPSDTIHHLPRPHLTGVLGLRRCRLTTGKVRRTAYFAGQGRPDAYSGVPRVLNQLSHDLDPEPAVAGDDRHADSSEQACTTSSAHGFIIRPSWRERKRKLYAAPLAQRSD